MAPIKPAAITATILSIVASSSFLIIIFLAMAVIVQKRKRMVKELIRADRMFTMMGIIFTLPPPKREKIFASIRNSGAPGGWPTSNLLAVAMNSPQSQKLPVGSIVMI